MPLLAGVHANKDVILVEIDSKVDAPVTITTPHHMTHEGKYFIASRYFVSVDAAAYAILRLLVGANKELHATVSVAAAAQGNFYIFEGSTYTENGTAVTIHDKNRTTANASDALCYHTPTVEAYIGPLYKGLIPGGSKQRAIGSVRTNGEEWIFKKSTDYLFRFFNSSEAACAVSIEVEFYEV